MLPRYTVRRPEGDPRYSVWDNEKGRIAVSEHGECADLGFDDAFKMADDLNNAQSAQPKER